MSKSNLAEEFFCEEKITEEEFSNLQLNIDIDNFCCVNEIDSKKYLTILKSNTLDYLKIPQVNYIKITQDYLIKKIVLHNVPETNYLLKINGTNAATFKKISCVNPDPVLNNYDYYVDIENLSNCIIDIFKSNNKTYIDSMKIDNLCISYPKNTNFNNEYIYYTLGGIKFNQMNETFEEINTKYKYYLNTTGLYFSHPTYFINVLAKKQNPNKEGNIYFYINGIEIKNLVVSNDKQDIYRINFNDIDKIIKKKYAQQDKYLSSKIASQTINLSRVNDFQIAFSNVIIKDITQFYYNVYSLPEMVQLFSD